MGTGVNGRHTVALSRLDLDVARALVTLVGLIAELIWLIASRFWTLPIEVCPLALLLMATPSLVATFVVIFIEWVYGYSKGVDGKTEDIGGDSKRVAIAMACIVIILASTAHFNTWQESLRTLESLFMQRVIIVVTSVNTTWTVAILLKVWKDYQDWKKVKHHGMFTWSFRKFVEERYKAAREGRTANFLGG